jgi:protease-4
MPEQDLSRGSRPLSGFAKTLIVLFIVAGIAFFGMVAAVAGVIGRASQENEAPHLVLLKIEGPIFDSEPWLTLIDRISEDETCRGVLVRIESPGGAVASSQELYGALKRLREQDIPVIVSLGNVAASGGYYAALAGEKIFSNPGTLTGSIGVIFQFPEVGELLDKAGISLQTVKSGALKDVGNPARKATESELVYLQHVIDDTYAQFVEDVAESRGLAVDSLRPIADGRVFTGRQALAAGLVDTLGGLNEAKDYLVARSESEWDIPWTIEPRPRSRVERFFDPEAKSEISELVSGVRERFSPGAFFLWP